MGNWIRCTARSGEKLLLNFDNALWMLDDGRGAGVSFAKREIWIKETPAELTNMGLEGPKVRAAHGVPPAATVPAIELPTIDVSATETVSDYVQAETSGKAEPVEW